MTDQPIARSAAQAAPDDQTAHLMDLVADLQAQVDALSAPEPEADTQPAPTPAQAVRARAAQPPRARLAHRPPAQPPAADPLDADLSRMSWQEKAAHYREHVRPHMTERDPRNPYAADDFMRRFNAYTK